MARETAVVLLSVVYTHTRDQVYNFEVEGLHNYYVSTDGILVHNSNCPIEFHHFIPKEVWTNSRIRQLFSAVELDALGRSIPQDWHKRLHGKGFGLDGAWNSRWKTWLSQNPQASKVQVLEFMESLKKEFGL